MYPEYRQYWWCVQSEKRIPDIGEIAEFCELEDAEENNKLRAKWFEKGQLSVKRKNESGCICIIDDNDEVVSVCGAHKAWMEKQLLIPCSHIAPKGGHYCEKCGEFMGC